MSLSRIWKLERKKNRYESRRYNTMSDMCVCTAHLTSPSVKILLLLCDIYNNSLPGTLSQNP